MNRSAHLLALSAMCVAIEPCVGKEGSLPVVDVRFEAPYQQIESSSGDEWAPTWGRDDVLYTGNDDGTSFGGMIKNAIAFGRLEGDDPSRLNGTTISSMRSFREIPYLGPEGAAWQTLDSYRIDDVLYRWAPCRTTAVQSGEWCVLRSSDRGITWMTAAGGPLNAPTRDGKSGPPHFVALGKSTATGLAESDDKYVYAVTHEGLILGEDGYRIARVPMAKLLTNGDIRWLTLTTDGTWQENTRDPFIFANKSAFGPDGANWKTTNTYSVDGVLYMFVTRCLYPFASSDPKHRHVWRNSSVIKSTDNGVTWVRDGEENYRKPMFSGQRFGAPYFVWYGKDGAATADNADKYVYAVSNDGYFENGGDYVLGRVLRAKLSALSASDWSFYRAGDGMRDASWTPSLSKAKPILKNPWKSGMTGMTYIGALHRYVMVAWHYHRDNFEQAIKDQDMSTVLEFLEAPSPWGPWSKIKTFDSGHLGWYTPIIGQRFQTVVDSSQVKVLLYTTGFYTKPDGGLDTALYKLNYMPITLSTKPLQHNTAFVGGR
jgi:hypothetical protein